MGKVVVLLLTAFVSISQIDGASFESDLQFPPHRIKANDPINSEITNYQNVFKSIIPQYLGDVTRWDFNPGLIRLILTSWNVSQSCSDHTVEWIYWIDQAVHQNKTGWALEKKNTWVLHLIDAWGKLPEGILSGHINALGDYDECVELRATDVIDSLDPSRSITSEFRGRYCNVIFAPKADNGTKSTKANVEPRLSLPITDFLHLLTLGGEGVLFYPSIATCFPSTCSKDDVTNIFEGVFDQLGQQLLYPTINTCFTDQKPDFVAADYGVMGLLAGIAALLFLGTVLDIVLSSRKPNPDDDTPPRKPGIGVQFLMAFSLKTNIRKLLNSKTGPGDFRCLHGMRFLSTMWVVAAHTWYVITFVPSWNMVEVKTVYDDWTILTMINSNVSVDTFFVLSGLLVTFNVLKMLDRTRGKFNLPMFYIHRYLRLTPTYAILIGVMATLWPYFGSGPYWQIMNNWSQFCKENWWTNLLYVNNLVHPKRMCYGEAWYLANDMQFYILSPLLLLPLWNWPLVGQIMMGIVTILSILSPGLRVYYFGNPTTPGTIGTRNMGDWFYSVNITPWARAQTYLVGMWMGYILYKTKGSKVRIPILVSVVGWIFFLASAYYTLYSIVPYFNPEKEIPDAVMFLYASLNKFVWGVGISWVMFACIHGYGGVVNTFLSWRAFVPLGRLTFSVYLISLHLQLILHLRFRQTITYDTYTMTNLFFAHAVMALLLGFICTVTLESPFIHLEKLILPAGGGGSPPRKRPNKRYGIFYNSQEAIMNEFDKKDEDDIDNNNVSNSTQKPEV